MAKRAIVEQVEGELAVALVVATVEAFPLAVGVRVERVLKSLMAVRVVLFLVRGVVALVAAVKLRKVADLYYVVLP